MLPVAARLLEALEQPGAAAAVRDLDRDGLLCEAIPELEEGRGFRQPDLHYYDVLQHNIAAVEAFDEAAFGSGREELAAALGWLDLEAALGGEAGGLPIVTLTRLACLLHDVAKPRTATITDGRLRFPRHGPEGSALLTERLASLGFDPESATFVARLVRQHLRPAELVRNQPPTDRALRKFRADTGGHVLPLMLLNLADGWATRGPGYTRDNFRRHCQFVNYVVALCTDS